MVTQLGAPTPGPAIQGGPTAQPAPKPTMGGGPTVQGQPARNPIDRLAAGFAARGIEPPADMVQSGLKAAAQNMMRKRQAMTQGGVPGVPGMPPTSQGGNPIGMLGGPTQQGIPQPGALGQPVAKPTMPQNFPLVPSAQGLVGSPAAGIGDLMLPVSTV